MIKWLFDLVFRIIYISHSIVSPSCVLVHLHKLAYQVQSFGLGVLALFLDWKLFDCALEVI